MNLTTQLHTIFIVYDDKNSDTTVRTIADMVWAMGFPCNALSLASVGQRLFGKTVDRTDPRIAEIAGVSRELLFAEVKAHVAFPVNMPFLTINAETLSDGDIRRIGDLADANGYGVDVVIVGKRTGDTGPTVLPTFRNIHHVERSVEIGGIDITDSGLYTRCLVDDMEGSGPIAIIGDVHERTGLLTQMLTKIPLDARIIFAGNMFDLGGNTKGTLTLLESLKDRAIIVRGHHERYIARRLRDAAPPVADEAGTYTALSTFMESPVLAKRFLALFERSTPFVKISRDSARSIFVTSAPAPFKFVGKISVAARAAQSDPHIGHDHQIWVDHMLRTASDTDPFYVFGTVSHTSPSIMHKNLVFLNTGAAENRRLSALLIDGPRITELSVAGPHATDEGATIRPNPVFHTGGHSQKPGPKGHAWLTSVLSSGASFVPGTIPHCPPGDILWEDPIEGLNIFRGRFAHRPLSQKKVLVAPLYEGTRAQLLLFKKNPGKNTLFVWNDGDVSRVSLSGFMDPIECPSTQGWTHTLLLDGEIVPGAGPARDTLQKQRAAYAMAVGIELDALTSDRAFAALSPQPVDIGARRDDLEAFIKQMSFAAGERMSFKPFDILSVDGHPAMWDGRRRLCGESILKDSPYKEINFNDPDANETIKRMLLETTATGAAGLIIRDAYPVPGEFPWLKVRGENYLRLIYGYNYMTESLPKTVPQADFLVAAMEYALGEAMLHTAFSDESGLYLPGSRSSAAEERIEGFLRQWAVHLFKGA